MSEAVIPFPSEAKRPIHRSEHNAPPPQWTTEHADDYIPSGSQYITATSSAVAQFERTKEQLRKQRAQLDSFHAETHKRVLDSTHSKQNLEYEKRQALAKYEREMRERHESINFGHSKMPGLSQMPSVESSAWYSQSLAPQERTQLGQQQQTFLTAEGARKLLLRHASPDFALDTPLAPAGHPDSPQARSHVPQPSSGVGGGDVTGAHIVRVCNTGEEDDENQSVDIEASRVGVTAVSKRDESRILYGIRKTQMERERERARAFVRNKQFAEQARIEQERRLQEIEEQRQWHAKTKEALASKRKVHVLSEIERKRAGVQDRLASSTHDRRLIDTHTRYMQAMRQEFLSKLKGKRVELPPLCACDHDTFENKAPLCANNCQFYNNLDAYRKALAQCLQSVEV